MKRSPCPVALVLVALHASTGLAHPRPSQSALVLPSGEVRLASGLLTLRKGWRTDLRLLTAPAHWLTVGPVDPDFADRQAQAALGLRYLERLGPGVWWVAISPGARGSDRAAWTLAGPLPAAAKIDPELTRFDGREEVMVLFHADLSRAEMKAPVPENGLSHDDTEASTLRARLSWREVQNLAAHDGVRWIASTRAERNPQPLMDRARRLAHVDEVQLFNPEPPEYQGLAGEGMSVMMFDVGAPFDHRDLAGRVKKGSSLATGHATAVAGIIAGSGVASEGAGGLNYQWRGIAPLATVVSGYGSLWELLFTEAIDATTSSVASEGYSRYSAGSALVDRGVRGGYGRPYTAIIAAANNGRDQNNSSPLRGYFSILNNAKNGLIVGSAWTFVTDGEPINHYFHSSMGPHWDGRLAPQLMAPVEYENWPKDGRDWDIDYIRFEDDSGAVGLAFEFEEAGEDAVWRLPWGLRNRRIENGALSTFNHAKGALVSPDVLGVTGDFRKLRIRMRMSGPADPLAVGSVVDFGNTPYCTPDCNPNLPPAARRWFQVSFEGEWQEYLLDIPGTDPVEWIRLRSYGGPQYLSAYGPGCARSSHDMCAVDGPDDVYEHHGGTSFAAPMASSSSLLLLEAIYAQTGRDRAYTTVWPATVRALLTHTAQDLVHQVAWTADFNIVDTAAPVLFGPGPDYATGYGLLDLRAAIDRATEQTWSEEAIREGDTRVFEVVVPPATGQLKVTLAWDDAPGAPELPYDAPKLVHDLDLRVTVGGATLALPLTLDPLPHELWGSGTDQPLPTGTDPLQGDAVGDAYEQEDHLNNMEQVVLIDPPAGPLHLEVHANAPLSAGPWQRFSLVSDLPFAAVDPCLSASTELCNGRDDDCNGVVDDVIDPEVCDDLLDNDCDGSVDEGCTCYRERPCLRFGERCPGTQTCTADNRFGICTPGDWVSFEDVELSCDGEDNDCDGEIDEDNVCMDGGTGDVGSAMPDVNPTDLLPADRTPEDLVTRDLPGDRTPVDGPAPDSRTTADGATEVGTADGSPLVDAGDDAPGPEGQLVDAETATIDGATGDLSRDAAAAPDRGRGPMVASGCSCANSHGSDSPHGLFALLVLGIVGVRRRQEMNVNHVAGIAIWSVSLTLTIAACSGSGLSILVVNKGEDGSSGKGDIVVADLARADTATPDLARADTATPDLGSTDPGSSPDQNSAADTANQADRNPPVGTEMLLYEGDGHQFTVADRGFHVLISPGDPLPADNWSEPVDYYSGKFHIRYVINGPADQVAGMIQVCIWTMGNEDGDNHNYFPESCSDQVAHTGIGTYYNTRLVPSAWWKHSGVSLVFAYPERFLIRAVLRGASGCNVTNYDGVSGSCWNLMPQYEDMNFRVTIVMVGPGDTFSGWSNYP